MKLTHAYVAPIIDSTQSKVNMEAWTQSIDRYNEGHPLEAFHLLLDHLNPEFRHKYGNADGTEFRLPHGSILVHVRIHDGRFTIHTDFLELPTKSRVAMLRQIADLNLNYLMLARFHKEGDHITMEYECPLTQCHPHKIYFLLRNICHIGDRYDDEFCTKFGARRSYEPHVTPYPPEEMQRILAAIHTTCRETLAAVKEYETERKYGYAWNLLDTALYKLSYFAHPQGQLTNELNKAVDDMDRELPLSDLLAQCKAFLTKVDTTPDDQLAADLYFVDQLVSTRQRSSLANVQENMKEVYREATEAIEAENYERSTVRMLYKFYEMYFYNDVQDDINALVAEALRQSGGKSMEEASGILYTALEKLMEDDFAPEEEEQASPTTDTGATSATDPDAESIARAQAAVAALQAELTAMQQRMQEALSRGDTNEYLRLAAELQQKLLGQTSAAQTQNDTTH